MRGFGVGAESERFYLREEDGVFGGGFLRCIGEGGEEEEEEGGVEEGEAHFDVCRFTVSRSCWVLQLAGRERFRPSRECDELVIEGDGGSVERTDCVA